MYWSTLVIALHLIVCPQNLVAIPILMTRLQFAEHLSTKIRYDRAAPALLATTERLPCKTGSSARLPLTVRLVPPRRIGAGPSEDSRWSATRPKGSVVRPGSDVLAQSKEDPVRPLIYAHLAICNSSESE